MKHVILFARRPQLGRVKTRLAADIGVVETLRFYRSTLASVSRRLTGAGGWATWIAVTPDAAVRDRRVWPMGAGLLQQGSGDLGARMERTLSVFGPDPAVIVGSDIPELDRAHLADAFDALRHNDFVFGPSDDGGYWLVGAKQGRRAGGLFDDVRWSSETALSDTLGNISGKDRVAMLGTLADIDDGAAYRAFVQRGSKRG